jgi:hypothetical protein
MSLLAVKTLAFKPVCTVVFVVLVIAAVMLIVCIKVVAMVQVSRVGVPSMFAVVCVA